MNASSIRHAESIRIDSLSEFTLKSIIPSSTQYSEIILHSQKML